MHLEEPTPMTKSIAHTTIKTLLIVGPDWQMIGGSDATVQAIIYELARYTSIRPVLINTSPSTDYSLKKMVGFNLEKVGRMIFIMRQYVRKIGSSDAVLVFANNLFALTIVPLLFMLARWFHKPFYLKPVGGDLDLYLAAQRKPIRSYMLSVLRATDGILAQTRQLQAKLTQLGCTNTHYVPGCRTPPQVTLPQNRNSEELGLIFLAHIHRQKGPLVLLEALRLLAQENSTKVTCDFYGPIFEEDRKEFLRQLEATPGARYCGVAKIGTACRVIAAYDALVLPTYYIHEGHPGVIIEAMQAGVPVISTQFRAIPELITHGENSLLVPVRDSHALAEAIKRMALDRPLREQMGKAIYHRGQQFRADVVVPQMLGIIFPE